MPTDSDTEVGGSNVLAIKFGENLKKIRKAKGYSQREFSEKLRKHFNTVASWEAGTSSPDAANIYTIVKVLEVSLPRLFFGDAAVSSSSLPESASMDADLFLKILHYLERQIDEVQPDVPAAKRIDLAAYAYRMAMSSGHGFDEADLQSLLRLSL